MKSTAVLSSDVGRSTDGGRKRPYDDKPETEETGYFLKSRKEAQKEVGVLVTGNDRTCVEDAVWNSSSAVFEKFGVQFDKDTLYSLFDKKKNTPFSIIQEYVMRSIRLARSVRFTAMIVCTAHSATP